MFRILRIEGDSLTPDIQEGDFVVLATGPFSLNRIKDGDIVVFSNIEYGTLIKRVTRSREDEVDVTGNHLHSIDSRRIGPIARKDIQGKVVWHIRKPR